MPIRSCAWQALDKQLPKLEEGSSAAAFSMENVLAEVEDLLSYCNDILCTGSSVTQQIVSSIPFTVLRCQGFTSLTAASDTATLLGTTDILQDAWPLEQL